MNRICIVIDKNGDITDIAADTEIEIFWVAPHCPRDRVYKYESAEIGPEYVRKWIGGYPVGHLNDGTFGIGEGSKMQPSKPKLTIVGSE
jgi:hypothetical protein